jgi:hypothetical protein
MPDAALSRKRQIVCFSAYEAAVNRGMELTVWLVRGFGRRRLLFRRAHGSRRVVPKAEEWVRSQVPSRKI